MTIVDMPTTGSAESATDAAYAWGAAAWEAWSATRCAPGSRRPASEPSSASVQSSSRTAGMSRALRPGAQNNVRQVNSGA